MWQVLVMSSGNPDVSNAFKIKTAAEVIELPPITTLTNGMPMQAGQHGSELGLAKTARPNLSVYAIAAASPISGIFHVHKRVA